MQKRDVPKQPPKLSPLQRQREFLDIATAFLSQGLKCDESRDWPKALELYGKGMAVLQEALGQVYPPSEAAQLEPLADLMRRHLVNFADRVGTLQVIIRQPPKPPAQPKPSNPGVFAKLFRAKAPAAPTPAASAVSASDASDEQLHRLQFNFLDATKQVPAEAAQRPKRSHSASATSKPRANSATRLKVGTKPAAKKAPATVPSSRPAGPSDESGLLVKQLEKAGIEPKLLTQVLSSIVTKDQVNVRWEDVTGLTDAKQALYEAAILPLQRPDLFTGLRAPARGILLFGPPGTGKTYLAKACAHTVKATFFSVSASTLTSKYVGEGEKLVKAIFMAAQELQPAIIFVDEIDSLLTSRSEGENEASRRLKTEFMVHMDGLSSSGNAANVLLLGATNRPFELDDAVLRRFPKRLCIPLPDAPAREALFVALAGQECQLSAADLKALAKASEGYSNSDITNVCREAVMVPIRELGVAAASVPLDQVRAVTKADFMAALKTVRPSTSQTQLRLLQQWQAKFGST